MPETVTIGGANCDLDYARSYADKYLNDHLSEDRNAAIWSYPAYDSYQGSPNGNVGDADLLAIALLNAGRRPVQAYYGLQHLAPEINKRLAHPALKGTLAEAGPDTIEAIVDLYNVANDGRASYNRRSLHVRLTVLSKVLHRKKPELLPLIDQKIRVCYIWRGDPAPLAAFAKDYESRAFTKAWILAAQRDLKAGEDHWQQLADLAPDPRISPLRAMDIIGWHLGQLTRNQLNELEPNQTG